MSDTATDIAILRDDIDTLVARMGEIEITTDAENEAAGDFLRKIKQTEKVVHDVLDPGIKDLYEPYKAATDERKGYLDALSKAEKQVRRKMNGYIAEQNRIRAEEERKRRAEEEERRLQTAIETGHEEVLDKPVVTQKPPEIETPAGIHTQTVWKWEVTDISKVHPMFLTVDEKAVNALVRSKKGEAAAMLGEGIRVYSAQEVRARV